MGGLCAFGWGVLFAGLLFEQGFESRQKGLSDDFGALHGGVDAVALDGAGDVNEVFVDHGDEGGVVFGGHVFEELLEGLDVLLSVVWREGDAGEQDADVGGFECGEHLVEVFARLVEREAAKTVVAAEFDDDDLGMEGDNGAQTAQCVFGGGAAGSLVVDGVVIAGAVEIALKGVGEGLAGFEAIAGGDGVAEADEYRPVCRERGQSKKRECD